MRNFYYVQSYNMMNHAIKRMLDTMGILGFHDSLAEMKIRSKYYIGYSEAVNHAQMDFYQKLPKIFPPIKGEPNENPIKAITIMNPKFVMSQLIEHNQLSEQTWDDNCCGTMFFCDAPNGDDDDDFPTAWMMKYEIFFEEDIIQLVRKNGEHAFEPAALAYQSYTSSLH